MYSRRLVTSECTRKFLFVRMMIELSLARLPLQRVESSQAPAKYSCTL